MSSPKTIYLPYHQRSSRWLFSACFFVGACLGGLLAAIFFWKTIELQELLELDGTVRRLTQAESKNEQLIRQVALYENASRVDQLAAQNMQDDLKAIQEKLMETGKELEFFRRIVSPQHRDSELRIQSFRIFRSQQLALTLSQGIGRDTSMRASAVIRFSGHLHGKKKELQLHEADRKRRSKLEFSFRYFQTATADVKFPDGFELESVKVTATPHTKQAKRISRVWRGEDLEMNPGISVSALGVGQYMN